MRKFRTFSPFRQLSVACFLLFRAIFGLEEGEKGPGWIKIEKEIELRSTLKQSTTVNTHTLQGVDSGGGM